MNLEASLGRHLISLDGSEGMDRLLSKVEPRLPEISAAWDARDFSKLGRALEQCAKASDASDIRAADFKLRCDYGSNYVFDAYVCSKIYEAIIEYLVKSDEAVVYEVANTISSIEPVQEVYAYDFIMRFLLIRLQLKRGMWKEAVANANINLSIFSACPHSQYCLYLALAQQRATVGLSDSPNVALQNLSDRFCDQPFRTLATKARREKNAVPDIYACHCPGLLPYPVSDGTDTQPVHDVWNGRAIQEIRRSVLDGDYTYCSRLNCPEILGGNLPKKAEIADPRLRDIIDNHKVALDDAPLTLSLSHDPSCNLACPSCRVDLFNIKNEQREKLDRFSDRILLPLMENAPVTLVLSGDGDPFGSKHYRQLLRSMDPARHSRVSIQLLTNGLLLTAREWDDLTNIHAMVGSISVSIDAAQADTYEDLRRPGKWSVITQNMDHLSRLRRTRKVPYVSINFVVQQKNYRQMPAFIEMTRAWGFDRALFLKIINIGSFTSDEFVESDVCDPRHPEHQDFLEVLRDPTMRWPEADLYTVKPYLTTAEAARPAPIPTADPAHFFSRSRLNEILKFMRVA